MTQHRRDAHPIPDLLRTEREGLDSLAELALDRRWSWTRSTAALWRQLDCELWEITHNPLVILRTTSRGRLQRMLADAAFRDAMDHLLQEARRTATAPAWLRNLHPDAPQVRAAYFSMAWGSC